MVDFVLFLLRRVLALRYRVKLVGLESIKKADSKGILFIPNHPALIDPPLVFSSLFPVFKLRPLVDENQLKSPLLGSLMAKIRAVTIPDMTIRGRKGKEGVVQAMSEVVAGLQNGDQFLFYPSGRIYRNRYESLRGNSGVAQILKEVQGVRVVLVRTTGLWGSSFSRASGGKPSLTRNRTSKLLALLSGGLFWMPKRQVTILLHEVTDLPDPDDRLSLNQYLENYYNQNVSGNSYVPYFWWHGRRAVPRPEPHIRQNKGDLGDVSGETRRQVLHKITDLSGNTAFKDSDTLASDVGMDSLAVADLGVWIEGEFGHIVDDIESLVCVRDVLLAASGQLVSIRDDRQVDTPTSWVQGGDTTPLVCPKRETITAMFVSQARRQPTYPIMADLLGGVKRYRDIVTGIFALVPMFRNITETNVGLMLPAGVTCTIAYYSLLFAGKTPVMVNWTMGRSNLDYCLQKVGVTKVITARALLSKLELQGFEMEGHPFTFICLEDVGKQLSTFSKLSAKIKSYTSIASLGLLPVQDIAAILFTSGSEARPKAVPLSHRNFIANIGDVNDILGICRDDVMVGMLPPFHSLGLTGTVLLPMSIGLQVVYHANPTEAALLASIIRAYRVSVLIGTPTFLNGILRGSEHGQLRSLRLAFTGAEKCPAHVYEAMAKENPVTIMCEGYGVTECAPLISVNHPENPVVGSIGKVLKSLDYVLVHPETKNELVERGEKGMLLVRGANVFSGYLNHDGAQPFIEFQGKQWYETGDLVVEDAGGTLHFAGRLKRFIKLGGEMISLVAIETVLLEQLDFQGQEGPVLAVETDGDEMVSELVLFVVFETDRHRVNQAIRRGGLSPLHNIRKVVQVAQIPVLGTGKTDYQSLKGML